MKRTLLKSVSLIMVVLMLLSVLAVNVAAAHIVSIVKIDNVHTPYAGYRPDYGCSLALPAAYTFDVDRTTDSNVYNGRYWYDDTAKEIVKTSDTFVKGHVYRFVVLIETQAGYEFEMNGSEVNIRAYINGKAAKIDAGISGRTTACIEYTFAPCDNNYEVQEVNLTVTEPVAGGHPVFSASSSRGSVKIGNMDSPDYDNGVAWYDCKNYEFMNFTDTFNEDGLYEVNILIEATGEYKFSVKDNIPQTKVTINGKEATIDYAGKDITKYFLVSYIFGDTRSEVSYVEITDIKEPAIGAKPIFTATPVYDKYEVSGVFWSDVTNSTTVSMRETDTFQAGHKYNLEIWIRANEEYKFSTDEDGYIDIMALVGGHQADVLLPGSDVSAELSVTFTLSSNRVIDYVEVVGVDTPCAGVLPDNDAFCLTRGCNVTDVQWRDITNGVPGVPMEPGDVFIAGRESRVIVDVVTEGDYTFVMDDVYNDAQGTINYDDAIEFGTYEETMLSLGYDFAPCEPDPNFVIFDFTTFMDSNV